MTRVRVLALLAAVCLAGSARAGAFESPIGFNSCASFDVAGDSMNAPGPAFTFAESSRQCEQLCKQAGRLCRAGAKEVAGCYLRIIRAFKSFEHKNCNVVTDTAADARECKQIVDGAFTSNVDVIEAKRGDAYADCETWTDSCRAGCLPL